MKSKCLEWMRNNLANAITFWGIKCCFVLLWFVVARRESLWTILFLAAAICLTDFFDGKAARHFNSVSKFGGAIDIIRDKLFLGIMFLFFILDGRVHISLKAITVPLMIAETSLLVMWMLGVKRRIDVSANRYGKTKMFLLSWGIILCLLNVIVEGHWGQAYQFVSTITLNLMFIVALFFAVKSFIGHRAGYLKQISEGRD